MTCITRCVYLFLLVSFSQARRFFQNPKQSSTALFTHDDHHVYDPAAGNGEDHSRTYNWPPEQDVMIFTHDGIRKELYDMKQVLTNNPTTLDPWQIDLIQQWWQGHEKHVRFHCRNENDQLHPHIHKRLLENDGASESSSTPSTTIANNSLLNPLRQDHAEINACLDTLSNLVANLKPNNPSSRKKFYNAWCHYMNVLLEHFQQEEASCILLTRRMFSAKEWSPIIKQFFDLGAKEEFGALIHAMGSHNFRTVFMKQRKIPGFVWQLSFSKSLNYYETHMWQYMETLLSSSSSSSSSGSTLS